MNNHLRNLDEWLDYNKVVDDEVIVLSLIAFLFLIVCLINTLALMLAKFLSKTKEIAIRRALGASKRVLFLQHLIESGMIGALGGGVDIFFSWLGLVGIRALFEDPDIVYLTSLDLTMLATAICIAVCASMITAIYPTWRACNIDPAAHLKG